MIPSKDRACRDERKLGSGPPAWVRRRPATTVVSAKDRFRDHLGDRLKGRLRDRLRFPRGFPRTALSCRTQAVFVGGSLCDISMPGCNSLSSSHASDEARPLVAVGLLGASPSTLAAVPGAGALLMRPLVLIPVTSLVGVSVAHRVVASRRPLVLCSRRSRLVVSLCEFAVYSAAVVVSYTAHPSQLRQMAGGCCPAARPGRALAVGPRAMAKSAGPDAMPFSRGGGPR